MKKLINICRKILPYSRAVIIGILSLIAIYQFTSIFSPLFEGNIAKGSTLYIIQSGIQTFGQILTELTLVLLLVSVVHVLMSLVVSGLPTGDTIRSNSQNNLLKDKALLGVILLAVLTRLPLLFTLSANLDEGIYEMIVPSINLNQLTPQLESGAPYLRGLPYTYIVAILNVFLKDPIISGRVLSFVCGILLVPMVYTLLKEMHSREAGRIGAILLTLFPTFILYSAQARQYSFNILMYVWIIYALLSSQKKPLVTIIIPLVLLSLSHEFVFLLAPLIFLTSYRKKDWINGGLMIAITLGGFLIQYFVFTKVTSQNFDTYAGGVKQLLALGISTGNIRNGITRVFQTLQYFYILIPLTIVALLGKLRLTGSSISLLLMQLLMEVSVFSFILARNQTRYRLTLVVLLIVITSILLVEVIRRSKKPFIIGILLTLIFLSSPITLDIPYDTKFPKENVETILTLTKDLVTDPHGYASIAGEAPITDYKQILKYDKLLEDKIVITTDLYNLATYTSIDYVYNIQLQTYSSYYDRNEPQTRRNVYHSTPFIDTPRFFELINTEKDVAIILDNRSFYHIPQEIRGYLEENFNMKVVAPNERTGVIHRSEDNGLYLFVSD